MMNDKVLGYVKLGLMVAGVAINVASSIVGAKELDNKIAEKAQEAVANMTKGDA